MFISVMHLLCHAAVTSLASFDNVRAATTISITVSASFWFSFCCLLLCAAAVLKLVHDAPQQRVACCSHARVGLLLAAAASSWALWRVQPN
jgi:hypothetical protein